MKVNPEQQQFLDTVGCAEKIYTGLLDELQHRVDSGLLSPDCGIDAAALDLARSIRVLRSGDYPSGAILSLKEMTQNSHAFDAKKWRENVIEINAYFTKRAIAAREFMAAHENWRPDAMEQLLRTQAAILMLKGIGTVKALQQVRGELLASITLLEGRVPTVLPVQLAM